MATWWSKAVLFLPAACLLGGCGVLEMLDPQHGIDMNAPTYMNPHKIRLVQGREYREVAAADVTSALVGDLARTYASAGGGPLDLVVTYPPTSAKAAQEARSRADIIARDLRRAGVRDVRTAALPAEGPALVTFSFTTYAARAPEECDPMPGVDGLGAELDRDYPMGCAVATAHAKQIAHPADLLGEDKALPPRHGQRVGQMLEDYRHGVPNQELGGESASGE